MSARTKPNHDDQAALANAVSLLQHRAGETGMFKTMHALHEANRVAGFELAEIMRLRKRPATKQPEGAK